MNARPRTALVRAAATAAVLATATAGVAGAPDARATESAADWQPSTPLVTSETRTGLIDLPDDEGCGTARDRIVAATSEAGQVRAVLKHCFDRYYYVHGSSGDGYTAEKLPVDTTKTDGPKAIATDDTGTYFLVQRWDDVEILKRSQDGEYRPIRWFGGTGYSLAAHDGRWWVATYRPGRTVRIWNSARDTVLKISPKGWAAVGAPKIAYAEGAGLVVAYAAVYRPTRDRADWTYAPVVQRLVKGKWTKPRRLTTPTAKHKFTIESLALPGPDIEVAYQRYSGTVGDSAKSWYANVHVAERRRGTWSTARLKTRVRTSWHDGEVRQDYRSFPEVTFHADQNGVRIILAWIDGSHWETGSRVLKSRSRGAWRTVQVPEPHGYPQAVADGPTGTTIYHYVDVSDSDDDYLAVLTNERP